jgi:hypothetical protein
MRTPVTTSTARAHRARRHLARLLSLAALAIVVLPLTIADAARAAKPIDIEQFGPSTDTFAEELCGISGTSATRFVGTFKLFADGTFLSTGNFAQSFTAASTGQQVRIFGVEQVTGLFNPTVNGNGTITQTFTCKGLPMKVSIENGPTLVRDAGNVTEAITFALNPDGSRGDVLSDSVLVQHGPHPQLDDDAVFCSAVTAALS